MLSSRNLSRKRANKLTYTRVGWRWFIGPFEQNDMAAIYSGIAALKNGRSIRGRPHCESERQGRRLPPFSDHKAL